MKDAGPTLSRMRGGDTCYSPGATCQHILLCCMSQTAAQVLGLGLDLDLILWAPLSITFLNFTPT